MKQIIIYKITDLEAKKQASLYFTLKGLRKYILNDLWNYWDNVEKNCNEYSKNEIENSDEYLFAFLYAWGYEVDRILISDNYPLDLLIN
jgi:hypothetical protein